jgi:hypothetical protein
MASLVVHVDQESHSRRNLGEYWGKKRIRAEEGQRIEETKMKRTINRRTTSRKENG